MRASFTAAMVAGALMATAMPVIAQDCQAGLAEARDAIKAVETAVRKAKDSGKAAAQKPLAKAKKDFLHAEGDCKTDGARDIRKNAEAARHAREVPRPGGGGEDPRRAAVGRPPRGAY